MAVIDISEYRGDSPRLTGVVLLNKTVKNLHIHSVDVMPTKVITEDTFLYFLKHKTFSSHEIESLRLSFKEMINYAPTKKIALRRAFIVPGLENPPGPYFLGITSVNEAIKSLERLFSFAIKHKYHIEEGSRIEAWFYPFIDPPEIKLPVTDKTIFPRGGYAAPMDQKANLVKILSVFGNNDGVQSLSSYDEYIIDTTSNIITKKVIPQKELALCTIGKVDEERVALPLSKQFIQVLSDWDILAVSQCIKESTRLAGSPQRIEFSWDGDKMFLNEAARFDLQEVTTTSLQLQGKTVIIETQKDLKKISLKKDQIVVISYRLVQKRDYDTLNALARIKKRLIVLYPGTAVTAHAMRVLIDAGHYAFVIGTQQFAEGIDVSISSEKGRVVITKMQEEHKKTILDLALAHQIPVSLVGGKAYNLGRLIDFGYSVPRGYVISTKVQQDLSFFKTPEYKEFLSRIDTHKRYAIRSSADIEDGTSNAFAGQFDSVINVSVAKLSSAVNRVWESAKKTHIRDLLKDLSIDHINMGVVVQEMIAPRISGVIFGGNVETKNENEVIIEIANGYADKVVNGVGKVRQIIFDKITHTIISDTKTTQIRVPRNTIQALFEMYMRLEANFSGMQDVEWTIDKKGELFIVQTRPLSL